MYKALIKGPKALKSESFIYIEKNEFVQNLGLQDLWIIRSVHKHVGGCVCVPFPKLLNSNEEIKGDNLHIHV